MPHLKQFVFFKKKKNTVFTLSDARATLPETRHAQRRAGAAAAKTVSKLTLSAPPPPPPPPSTQPYFFSACRLHSNN